MKRTAPHRAAWIRSSGTKTMEEINREYPKLHDFPGMISQDFRVVFPDLYEFWAPVITDRILLFAKKEPKASDVLPENLKTLAIDPVKITKIPAYSNTLRQQTRRSCG